VNDKASMAASIQRKFRIIADLAITGSPPFSRR